MMDLVHTLVAQYGFGGLFLVMALGNMGLPAGTEIVVPTAGALAAQGHFGSFGEIPAWLIVGLVATLAEIVGGSVLYTVGYYGGEPFVHRYGKYVMFREHELARVHAFYVRYGHITVLLCRFIPFVRGVSAFPAGISRMPKRYFLTYTALGSAVFCFGLAALGDAFGKRIDRIVPYLHRFSMLIAVIAVIAIAGGIAWWLQRRARSRARALADERTLSSPR